MALSEASRTRIVRWLKVALPLAAMILLSTLFLVSRSADPMAEIPFATIDLKESAQSERISEPSFAGVTDDGDQVTFTADSALPGQDGEVDAEKITAQIALSSGGSMTIHADTGHVEGSGESTMLRGSVVVTSSTGYRLTTEAMELGLRETRVESEGQVDGDGPAGTLTAGKMKLTTDPETGAAYMVFTGGVKLVYEPGTSEE